MNGASYILIGLIVLWILIAVIYQARKKGCDGNCAACKNCINRRNKK